MFAGFLGLTILGDCVSALSIHVEIPLHGSSLMAFFPSNVGSFASADSQLTISLLHLPRDCEAGVTSP